MRLCACSYDSLSPDDCRIDARQRHRKWLTSNGAKLAHELTHVFTPRSKLPLITWKQERDRLTMASKQGVILSQENAKILRCTYKISGAEVFSPTWCWHKNRQTKTSELRHDDSTTYQVNIYSHYIWMINNDEAMNGFFLDCHAIHISTSSLQWPPQKKTHRFNNLQLIGGKQRHIRDPFHFIAPAGRRSNATRLDSQSGWVGY